MNYRIRVTRRPEGKTIEYRYRAESDDEAKEMGRYVVDGLDDNGWGTDEWVIEKNGGSHTHDPASGQVTPAPEHWTEVTRG